MTSLPVAAKIRLGSVCSSLKNVAASYDLGYRISNNRETSPLFGTVKQQPHTLHRRQRHGRHCQPAHSLTINQPASRARLKKTKGAT
jgi:hypothetical protein